MNNENSEAKAKEPIIVKEGKLSLEINTESDGRGGIRYYFNDPTKMNSKGTRARKVHSPSLDIIKKRATEVLKELTKDHDGAQLN